MSATFHMLRNKEKLSSNSQKENGVVDTPFIPKDENENEDEKLQKTSKRGRGAN